MRDGLRGDDHTVTPKMLVGLLSIPEERERERVCERYEQ